MSLGFANTVFAACQKIGRHFGIEINLWKPDHHYVSNFYGRAAFKQIDVRQDRVFKELADQAIRPQRSMLYYDRLYTIFQALENISRLQVGEVHIVEVGMYKGGTISTPVVLV